LSYKISQASFIHSLRPVFEDARLKWLSPDELADLLDRYWLGISNLCSQSVKEPKKHLLMKTTGVSVLHQILPDVVAYLTSKGKKIRDLSAQDFIDVLQEVPEMTDGFWSSANEDGAKRYLGEVGARGLAKQLRKSLPRPED
jgi:hypothetical protein